MPVNPVPLNSAMILSFQTGINHNGFPIIQKKTLRDLRFDADPQDIYDVAHALFSLTEHPILEVIHQQNYDLVDEP